jgi:hypothetical protein
MMSNGQFNIANDWGRGLGTCSGVVTDPSGDWGRGLGTCSGVVTDPSGDWGRGLGTCSGVVTEVAMRINSELVPLGE